LILRLFCRICKKFGGLRNLEYDSTDRPVMIEGAVQDITEQKNAERNLSQNIKKLEHLTHSREILALTADHVGSMLGYWDRDLVCRFANNAYLMWLGVSSEDIIDKMTLKELLGSLFDLNKPYVDGVLGGTSQTFEREIPIPGGYGSRHSLANYFPHIVNGEVVGFFAHVVDITPVKVLEDQLKESNQKLNEQNHRLLNFANIVTHNLKSYAGNLGLVLQMLVDAETEAEKKEMIGFLKDISSGFSSTIVHLTEVVDSQNKREIKKEQVLLYDFLNKAINAVRLDIEQTKAVVSNRIDPSLKFLVNTAYMDSIFHNLLSNAIKYRHPDRIPIIEITAENTQHELIIRFADNGRGINLTRHKDNVFGMYKTFHGNQDATGVGLYLVRSQVEAMDGTIDVESEENVGTTFILRFEKK